MIIDAEKKNISVWLVKLPSFLVARILEMKEESEVGEILVGAPSEDSPATIQFKLSPELLEEGFPSDYTLNFTNKSERIYLFRESAGFRIEGYINKEIFINPELNETYFAFTRNRARSEGSQSSTKVINYMREGIQCERFGSVSELEYLDRKRRKIRQAKKRVRLEKSDIIDILFKAFEKRDAWTIRDLADFTGQPVAFIQKIVPRICTMNKRDYKNLYELKPEYRSTND